MTVESHQLYEAATINRRRLNTRRRLLSAPTGAGDNVGKTLVKSIIKVIPSTGDKKTSRVTNVLCLNGLRSDLPKTVIIKRAVNGAATIPNAISKRAIVPLQSLPRDSPVADSSSGFHGQTVDSPHDSLSHSELDDYIIDEILSLEDDQMALREGGGSKTQPLSVSYTCNDKLTTVSSPRHGAVTPHSSRVSNSGSPGVSGSSRSPIGIPINSSFRQVVSSSAPASSIDMETLVREANTEINSEFDYRDRRKKDIHNMIERRRRYNINDRIKELGGMLPKHSAEEMKLNKGTILKASCDYIRQLRKEHEILLRQQQQQTRIEQAARVYAERVKELEEQLQKNGISVPPTSQALPPIPSLVLTTHRPIKQEPYDDISPTSSHTPTGSISSAGFVSQLSDNTAAMAISGMSYPDPNRSNENGSIFSPRDYNGDRSVENRSPSSHLSLSALDWRLGHIAIPSQQQAFPDFIMEDLSSYHSADPLLQGDPMISAAGGGPSPHGSAHISSQISPDGHWDQASFSLDSQQNHVSNSSACQHPSTMDFS